MVHEEKTLSSEMIYEGAILNLRRDKVTVIGDKTSYREIVEHNGGVVIAAVTHDGQMPMVRQYRKAVEQMVLEVPAGKLEKGEDPKEAAFRELKEETGYTAGNITLMSSAYSSIGYSSEILHTFFATELTQGETAFDEGEAIDVLLYPIEQLYYMIIRGEIVDLKSIAAILMVREQIQQEALFNMVF
jgi:ADP-ribose pyrophosphatase